MHHRRIACFLIGVWMAGTLVMAYVLTQNIAGVDDLIGAPTPGAAKLMLKVGKDTAAQLFRYQAAELNRLYLGRWEWMQILLAVLLGAVLYLGTHVNRIMVIICGVVVLLTGFMHFVLTPEIEWLGRGLDFATPSSGGRTRLLVLHGLYLGLEAIKFVLACAIAGYLFVFKTRTRQRPAGEAKAPLLTRAGG